MIKMQIQKEKTDKIQDEELEKLIAEMDKFDDEFRVKICNKIKNHEKFHANVLVYSSGKSYCDNMRNVKARKFKKRLENYLNFIASK